MRNLLRHRFAWRSTKNCLHVPDEKHHDIAALALIVTAGRKDMPAGAVIPDTCLTCDFDDTAPDPVREDYLSWLASIDPAGKLDVYQIARAYALRGDVPRPITEAEKVHSR